MFVDFLVENCLPRKQVAMKFETEEKVKIKSLQFSVFGLNLDTDFRVSGGCQWKLLERAILVTCSDYWVSPDVGQRLDIWISGPWDIIELNSILFDGKKTLVRVNEEDGNLRWTRVTEGSD